MGGIWAGTYIYVKITPYSIFDIRSKFNFVNLFAFGRITQPESTTLLSMMFNI